MAISIATEDGDYVGTATPGAISFSTILATLGVDPSLYIVTDPGKLQGFRVWGETLVVV